jgi:hypothetical protein
VNALVVLTGLSGALAQTSGAGLEWAARYSGSNLDVGEAIHRQVRALKVVDKTGQATDSLVPLPIRDFRDGVIEAEVAGQLGPTASDTSRGFIGVAFRVQADPARYEAFYIRPLNGRDENQLRRNHSTQYIAMPEHPWNLLREKSPGLYESYADMAAGEWTKLRIEVDGARARFFVGGASQPTLIVNDLKLGADAQGGVALWIGDGTEGYFRNVRVTPAAANPAAAN